MKISELLSNIFKYLTTRETNYHIRTLTHLYDEETKILEKIIQAHSDTNNSPSGDYTIMLTSRLKKNKKPHQGS